MKSIKTKIKYITKGQGDYIERACNDFDGSYGISYLKMRGADHNNAVVSLKGYDEDGNLIDSGFELYIG